MAGYSKMILILFEYAKNVKKSETEIRNSMKPAAEKKAKLQLVLNEIADPSVATKENAW